MHKLVQFSNEYNIKICTRSCVAHFVDVASIRVDSCDTFTYIIYGYFTDSNASVVTLQDVGKIDLLLATTKHDKIRNVSINLRGSLLSSSHLPFWDVVSANLQ